MNRRPSTVGKGHKVPQTTTSPPNTGVSGPRGGEACKPGGTEGRVPGGAEKGTEALGPPFSYVRDGPSGDHARVFHASERYGPATFDGNIPDTGASQWSTGGKGQFQALRKVSPVLLSTSIAGTARISFGPGEEILSVLGTVEVNTKFGTTTFRILAADTPFPPMPEEYGQAGHRVRQHEE